MRQSVLSQVLRGTQSTTDAQLAALFSGNRFAGNTLSTGDNKALAGLVGA